MYTKVWNSYNLSRVYIFYFTKTQKLWSGDFCGAKVTLSKESKFGNPWLEIWKTSKTEEGEKSQGSSHTMRQRHPYQPEHIFCEYESSSVHGAK